MDIPGLLITAPVTRVCCCQPDSACSVLRARGGHRPPPPFWGVHCGACGISAEEVCPGKVPVRSVRNRCGTGAEPLRTSLFSNFFHFFRCALCFPILVCGALRHEFGGSEMASLTEGVCAWEERRESELATLRQRMEDYTGGDLYTCFMKVIVPPWKVGTLPHLHTISCARAGTPGTCDECMDLYCLFCECVMVFDVCLRGCCCICCCFFRACALFFVGARLSLFCGWAMHYWFVALRCAVL